MRTPAIPFSKTHFCLTVQLILGLTARMMRLSAARMTEGFFGGRPWSMSTALLTNVIIDCGVTFLALTLRSKKLFDRESKF